MFSKRLNHICKQRQALRKQNRYWVISRRLFQVSRLNQCSGFQVQEVLPCSPRLISRVCLFSQAWYHWQTEILTPFQELEAMTLQDPGESYTATDIRDKACSLSLKPRPGQASSMAAQHLALNVLWARWCSPMPQFMIIWGQTGGAWFKIPEKIWRLC